MNIPRYKRPGCGPGDSKAGCRDYFGDGRIPRRGCFSARFFNFFRDLGSVFSVSPPNENADGIS
jgi:hypothetical protein